MLFLLGLICLLPLTANAGNELDTNIISADNKCQPFRVRLPHAPDYYILDFDNFYFEDDFCYSATDWDRFMKCSLKEDDAGYIATLWVCDAENHIRLSWRMPEFIELAPMSYITQFFMPEGQWKKRDEYCLQPQYSTPLIRTNLTKDSVEIKCVIYLPSCYYSEQIQIYGLYESYCGGKNPVKDCGRRIIGTNLIEFTTTVPHNPHNKTQDAYATSHRHKYYYSVSLRKHDHAVSLPDHDHAVSLPDHDYAVSLPDHDYAMSLPDHDYSMSLPDHDHAVSLPDHDYAVPLPDYNYAMPLPDYETTVSMP
ncbi:hypothetical protein AAHC03_023064 [Spirometra sp. Aus1]